MRRGGRARLIKIGAAFAAVAIVGCGLWAAAIVAMNFGVDFDLPDWLR